MSHSLFRISVLILAVAVTACSSSTDSAEEGMVFFEGGSIMVGANDMQPNEYPEHQVKVDAFYISKSPVTVAEFRQFVKETGYVTKAEKFGNSGVFDVKTGEWNLVDGATWRYPFGKDEPEAKQDHPVTQVSWDDARAYCKWAGVRLPTEKEWEFAAKSGTDSGERFSWGNKLVTEAGFRANVWQGKFPDSMRVEDGYQYTSPVGAFGETKVGLTDMGGNVWEWTSSTYDLYKGNPYKINKDPKKKVIKGGSFLCDSTVCYGYRVAARNFNSRESATVNMGFRTAKDAR